MVSRRSLIKLFALAPIVAAIPIEFTAEEISSEVFLSESNFAFGPRDFEKILEAAARELAKEIDSYIADKILEEVS